MIAITANKERLSALRRTPSLIWETKTPEKSGVFDYTGFISQLTIAPREATLSAKFV